MGIFFNSIRLFVVGSINKNIIFIYQKYQKEREREILFQSTKMYLVLFYFIPIVTIVF